LPSESMSRAFSLAGFEVTLIGRFWVTTEVAAQRIKVNVFRSQTVAAMFAIHPATSLRLSYENPIRRSIAGATEAARVHQSLQQKRPIAIAQFPVTGKLPCALPQDFAG